MQHLPVATLLDGSGAELKQFGLPAAARQRLLAATELARRFQPTVDLPGPHDQPRHLLPYLADLRGEPEGLGIIPLDSRLGVITGLQRIAGGHLMHLTVAPRGLRARTFAPRRGHRPGA
ncbi:MAG: hypothetical protein E6J41_33395 [Chloroflexi bacterium]|nr:MAG: hypothetical protein E6J41_33395 [Chloroflexota bacterium]